MCLQTLSGTSWTFSGASWSSLELSGASGSWCFLGSGFLRHFGVFRTLWTEGVLGCEPRTANPTTVKSRLTLPTTRRLNLCRRVACIVCA